MLFSSELKIRWIKRADRYLAQFIVIFIYCMIIITGGTRQKKAYSKKPEKILLIKFFGIGNIFLLLPVARILKSNYPHASIDLLTLSYNKGVAEHVDVLDRGLYIEVSSLCSCIKDIACKMFVLRRNKYDLVLDFEQFATFSALCVFLSGAFSIGFKVSNIKRHLLYTQSVPYIENKHMSDIFMTLIGPTGCQQKEESAKFYLETEERRIRDFFKSTNIDPVRHFVIIFHPGSSANFPYRRWPIANFKELTKKLITYDKVRIVLTGKSEDEARLAYDIKSEVNTPNVVDVVGKFRLEEFIAVIKLSNLVISSDTAPIQIASYLYRPSVSFFGPNTPLLYGPKNSGNIVFYKYFSCSPCISNLNSKNSNCRIPRCINAISAEEVFREINYRFFITHEKHLQHSSI